MNLNIKFFSAFALPWPIAMTLMMLANEYHFFLSE